MASSLVDFLAEKLLSFTKMKDDCFQHHNTSYFIGGGKNSAPHWNPLNAVSVLRQNSVLDFDVHSPYYRNTILNHFLGLLDSSHIHNFQHNLQRPDYISHLKHTLFSPHLLNFICNLNSNRNQSVPSNQSLLPCNSILLANMMNNLLWDSLESKVDSKANCGTEKTCVTPIGEVTMSVSVSRLPTKKMNITSDKVEQSDCTKLNLKLANRKTKQLNKRSKKRRRRQKKSQPSSAGNAIAFSDDDFENSDSISVSSHVFVTKSPDFGCSISFRSSVPTPSSVSSFVVPISSDSDDESDWETYDEKVVCNSDSDSDIEASLSSNSSPFYPEKSESKCSSPKDSHSKLSSFITFQVCAGDYSDEDSDWSSSESEAVTETSEFEFSGGLFLSNLGCSQSRPSNLDCSFTIDFEDEESLQLKKMLQEVNKNWNELTKDDTKPKSVTKVTFAPDEELVEEFPVEIYERKGEWEVYATERLRFKRKIDELEKILSPCFAAEHRSKILKKLMDSEL